MRLPSLRSMQMTLSLMVILQWVGGSFIINKLCTWSPSCPRRGAPDWTRKVVQPLTGSLSAHTDTHVSGTGCPSSLIEPNSHPLARNSLISVAQLPQRLQSIIAGRTGTLVRFQTGSNGPTRRDETWTQRFNRQMSITNHKSRSPTGQMITAGCAETNCQKE